MNTSRHTAINTRAQSAQAAAALPQWKSTPLAHRLRIIRKMRFAIASNALDIAKKLTQSLPQRQNAAQTLASEILPMLEGWRYLEKNATRVLAPKHLGSRQRPAWLWGARSTIHRDPKGVVLIICPFNFPLMLAGAPMTQALAAGNTVLLKPAQQGQAAAELLVKIARDAGLPRDVLQVMDASIETGLDAINSGNVNHVIMTGSTAAGQAILSHCAHQLASCSLELSGCDAVFVLPDANVIHLSNAMVFGLTLNSGATCIAPRRMYVHTAIHDEVCAQLQKACTAIPPLNAAPAAAARLVTLARDAVANGAKVLTGDLNSTPQMQPLVLCDVKPNDPILQNDIFAPVLSIVRVQDMEEALALNETCPYALGASVFGSAKQAAVFASRIHAGSVTVNDLIVPTADPRLPFGGRKSSGFGVTRGDEGLLELTNLRCVTHKPARFQMHLRAQQPQDEKWLAFFISLTHAAGWRARFKAMATLWKKQSEASSKTRRTHTKSETQRDHSVHEGEPTHAKI